MPVMALDHVNVRTPDPQGTLAFFRDVLEMKVGPGPGMESIEKGGWVYDSNDLAVVHIGSVDTAFPTDGKTKYKAQRGSGAVHHVALSCQDFEAMKARLASLEFAFRETDFPQFGFRQLFVTEPNGVLLELNFRT